MRFIFSVHLLTIFLSVTRSTCVHRHTVRRSQFVIVSCRRWEPYRGTLGLAVHTRLLLSFVPSIFIYSVHISISSWHTTYRPCKDLQVLRIRCASGAEQRSRFHWFSMHCASGRWRSISHFAAWTYNLANFDKFRWQYRRRFRCQFRWFATIILDLADSRQSADLADPFLQFALS